MPIDFIEDEPKIDFQPAESAGDALSNWKSLDRYPDLPEPERRKKIYSDYLRSRQEDVAAQGEGAFAQALPETLQEPLVSPEDVRKFIFLPDAKPGGVREGIEKSISSLISAPTTPAIGAAMALTPIAPQVMLPAWAYQGLKDVPEAIAQTVTGETPSEKVQGGLRTAMDLLMLHGGTKARPLRLTEPELATLDQVDKARVMPPQASPIPQRPLTMADVVEREAQRSVVPKIDFVPDKLSERRKLNEQPASGNVSANSDSSGGDSSGIPTGPTESKPIIPAPVTTATLDRLEAEGKAPETKAPKVTKVKLLPSELPPVIAAAAPPLVTEAETPKFKVTQDGQPYGVFSNEAQANMVASGLSGKVEVSPVTEAGAAAEIKAEKEAASLADENKVVPLPKPPKGRTPAQQFDDLIIEHGLQLGWVDNPDALFAQIGKAQDTASIKAKLFKGKALAAARRKAAGDLGLNPGDVDTIAGRAKALDVLKKHIEERNAPDTLPEPENADTNFLPEEKPKVPKLRPGEKGTGDLLQGKDAPFNLFGETAVDTERVAREKADAEKRAAEAKAAQEKQQPGLTGMGAAVPSEFVPSGKATAVKNAAVDAERQSRGQPPILAPQRLKNAVVWDRVMAKIDREPEWQDRLIADLQENPRTPSQDEILALDHRYVDLQNEYAKATRDGAQAYSDRRMEDVQDAKARAAIFERQLSELEQVARKVGTEWGRSGQMRQRLMKEDFTLAAMESRWRAAKNFEPLTEKEHTEIAELQRKIALADQKAIEATARFNERIAILEAQKALAEAKALAQPAYEPRILQAAERFAKAMEKKGDEAMARIKARLGRTSAGVDPTILSDVGIVGAAKLTRGLVDFAKWTDAMARDIGEWIREHAQEAWDASQKVFNENLEGFNKGADKATADKVKKATDLPGRISATRTAIAEKAAKGAGSPLHTEVRKLVRLLIEQDRTMSRDAVIDTVHGILKESMPEITRLEAMDAISGRGKFWTPPKDEVSKRVRDLATQIRLIGHQIDVEAKRPLPRTGYQPDKFSDAARKEQQKLNDLKRQYGVVVTDPNAQLASVLQAIKTRLLNERKDLQERLTKGDFSPRRKLRDVPLDAEAAKAKAEVLLLREKFQKGLDHQRYLLKSSAEKAWLGIKEGLNLSRAILTSWDVSAVFRQGGVIALGNPLRAARSLGPMFRALASEKNAAAIEAEILSRPNAKLYAQSKLFLAPREGAHLSGMEEAFMSRLASKIPGVAGSGRAYITFLNRLRADTFDAMHADLTAKTPTELQAISNYINVATGRGNLGKVAGAAETLSTVFFAPRLVASRFQLLAAEPLYRGSAQTRYLVAKEYAKFLGGLAVIYGLGKLAGATVQTDPRSTDFGKLKFGNTRVDPLSGLSQVTVLLSRLGSGKMMNAKGQIEPIRGKVKFGHSSSADLIARFLRSKLSPWIGNTIDVLAGKNVVGETVTPGSVAVNMTVPLALRDIYDVMKEQGIAEGTIISILSLFGMSIQNYDAHKKPK